MSIDYQVWCRNCRISMHLGQAMGGGYSFGYGPSDIVNHVKIMAFIADHVSHEIKDLQGTITGVDDELYLRIGYDHPEGYGCEHCDE